MFDRSDTLSHLPDLLSDRQEREYEIASMKDYHVVKIRIRQRQSCRNLFPVCQTIGLADGTMCQTYQTQKCTCCHKT
jgi:hypothetical protein